ncbi:MAG: aspartate aminotransferase family protein [Rhodospirillales bacterium]|nr:aspartate aminotransferase family protein [Rhodospirillales bacterium]
MITSVMPTYARIDVAFERGEGVYLFDTNGRRYLDFVAGIAVDALGHCHPHLVEQLTSQVGKLWHTSNLYRVPGQEKLADRLVANTFADSVFFTNSGAEAIECSLKAARRYHATNGAPERFRVICANNAFHGRTLATIAAGGQAKHLDGFGPVVEGFDHVPFGNMNEMRAAITPETAAILVEPVQGEGGVTPAPEGYLKALRETADEFGILLIFDEVQCGVARSGKFFAHEWSGITPDVMAVAKGIGGGFPVGACLAVEKVALALSAGTHGTTYGGNPLAMSAANAVLDIVLEDGFMGHVEQSGRYLRRQLEGLVSKYPSLLADVRGMGLMLGLKCVEEGKNAILNGKLFELGLLTALAGDNVVRFVPPLIVTQDQIDEAITIIDNACQSLGAEG